MGIRKSTLSFRLFVSGIISGILLVVVYILNNYAFPFFSDTSKLTFIESRIQSPGRGSFFVDTSCVFINVGYEANLVETRHGREKITDRAALIRILNDLKDRTDYKEIFIDIRFEQGLQTGDDSALVKCILSMPNICLVKHWDHSNDQDYPLMDDRLLELAGYADYSSTIFNTSFSRYEFIQHGKASAALKLYNDIDASTIVRRGKGIFSCFHDNGRLCYNSAFIRIPEDMSSGVLRYRDDETHSFRYYNLSEDIYGTMSLDLSMQERFFRDCRDKVIVIGDFSFDQHDTYFNRQPGPYLNYLAYTTLRDGRHLVTWWLPLIAFLVYFGTIILIFKKVSWFGFVVGIFYRFLLLIPLAGFRRILHNLRDGLKSSFFAQVISRCVDSTGILSLVSYILFITSGRVLSIFFPSIVFGLIELIVSYKRNKHNEALH